MRRFSAERWLGDLVETEGTASQKAKWAEILAGLSLMDGVDVDDRDDALRGLPADLRMVAPQPLQEVEVYRSLDELEVDEEAAEDEDEA